jgi:hypothetical protein
MTTLATLTDEGENEHERSSYLTYRMTLCLIDNGVVHLRHARFPRNELNLGFLEERQGQQITMIVPNNQDEEYSGSFTITPDFPFLRTQVAGVNKGPP